MSGEHRPPVGGDLAGFEPGNGGLRYAELGGKLGLRQTKGVTDGSDLAHPISLCAYAYGVKCKYA